MEKLKITAITSILERPIELGPEDSTEIIYKVDNYGNIYPDHVNHIKVQNGEVKTIEEVKITKIIIRKD